MDAFRKHAEQPDALRYERAGLAWLAEAVPAGGAPVVRVHDHGPGWLETERLTEAAPDRHAAEAFGRALARTHAAGAPGFGCPPPAWSQDGFMGRAPLPLTRDSPSTWGEFYAEMRVRPYLPAARANGSIDDDGLRTLHRFADRVAEGVHDAPQPALVDGVARLHGDLWGGNVLWARGGGLVAGTLIDPAAHGGHAESDLAQLAVFGAPHLDRILAAYEEVSPPAQGWRRRVGLHQMHVLVVHAALFGGGYGAQCLRTAQPYL